MRFGCQGNFTLRLAELGYRVTWNDIRQDLAGYVQLKWKTGDVTYRPGNILEPGAPCRVAERIEDRFHRCTIFADAEVFRRILLL